MFGRAFALSMILFYYIVILRRLISDSHFVVIPRLVVSHHRVQADEQLTHTGYDRYFLGFPLRY